MAVTLVDLKARVESDLDDEVLQRILDSNLESVERSAGNADSEVEHHEALGTRDIVVSRPIASVDQVVERYRRSSDPVTLSANDYRLVGKYKLYRMTDGDNPASSWGREVEVTYTPEVDQQVRDRMTLDLCLIDVEFSAWQRWGSGDWDGDQSDWKSRRREVLAHLREGRSPIL